MTEGEYGHAYKLSDLLDVWKGGWRRLAEFAEELGFERYSKGYSSSQEELLWAYVEDAADEIFRHVCRGNEVYPGFQFHDLVSLVPLGHKKYNEAAFADQLWRPSGPATSDRHSLDVMARTLLALSGNQTVGDAIFSLVGRANAEMYGTVRRMAPHEGMRSPRIGRSCAGIFAWLHQAATREVSEEESWWNCAWLSTDARLGSLRKIESLISQDIPLHNGQQSELNYYLQYGRPVGRWIVHQDGSKIYDISLEVTHHSMPLRALERAATALLVQPVFRLVQELRKKCSAPRFAKQCHAPSCGKWFYTRRRNANACPSTEPEKKSNCALEWVRYQRYLRKIRKNPDEDWTNPELQKQFISCGPD